MGGRKSRGSKYLPQTWRVFEATFKQIARCQRAPAHTPAFYPSLNFVLLSLIAPPSGDALQRGAGPRLPLLTPLERGSRRHSPPAAPNFSSPGVRCRMDSGLGYSTCGPLPVHMYIYLCKTFSPSSLPAVPHFPAASSI